MNDGACDSRGRFWAGSMVSTPGGGGLWRLSAWDRPKQALAGVTVSNGIAWSPDDRTCYYVDSQTGRLDAFVFDADAATLSDRRTVARIDPSDGVPDGIAIDAHGCIWVAVWGAGALQRYRPDGALDQTVDVPVSHVSSCAFGGPELGDLYVTTARQNLAPATLERQPNAGGLFRFRPAVRGLASGRFQWSAARPRGSSSAGPSYKRISSPANYETDIDRHRSRI
jgi:sugar lactone lactonase YvrE